MILNTGGTFNKRYDPIRGELFVPVDDAAIKAVLCTFAEPVAIKGLIYKDSLEMNDADREMLCRAVAEAETEWVVIIHGTDTMELSAAAVAAMGLSKTVVFTGAMVPFSIDAVEATANLAMAIGYAKNAPFGVHIVMQGICGSHERVKKNRELGKFEHV